MSAHLKAVPDANASIVVERDVPLLRKARRGGKPAKYPWREMEVGDSFFVVDKSQAAISSAANSAKKTTGFKFATRKVDGGVRVWRIA